MKSTPTLAKVREKMMPGIITRDGFLGEDTRSLSEIIQDDEAMMLSLGLDWQEVSTLLRSIFESGKKGFGSTVEMGDISVAVEESRGKLPCPFGDGLYPKHTAKIVLKPSGSARLISELSLHLLEAHHFLEGRLAQYRVEPRDLKNIISSIGR